MTGKDWERRREEDDEWVPAGEYTQAWKHGPQVIIWVLVMVALLTAGTFTIRKYLLPAEEALRREVYEESKSYNDGTIRDLDNLRLQWIGADNEVQKSALAQTALHRAQDFPREDLPERVRDWLAEIER